jgi:hypothetical protein
MVKLWPLADRCNAIQRWAYVTPSCMLAAWSTLEGATLALVVATRKDVALPVALAPLIAGFVTAIGLAVLWVRFPA